MAGDAAATFAKMRVETFMVRWWIEEAEGLAVYADSTAFCTSRKCNINVSFSLAKSSASSCCRHVHGIAASTRQKKKLQERRWHRRRSS